LLPPLTSQLAVGTLKDFVLPYAVRFQLALGYQNKSSVRRDLFAATYGAEALPNRIIDRV
jgi:hypothetical protein